MTYPILLLTADVQLAERVRRALPANLPLRLDMAPGAPAASRASDWLLAVLDARSAGESNLPLPAARLLPAIWLGQSPRVAAGASHAWPGPILDYLDRSVSPPTLALVLGQHLTAAYLRRIRRKPAHAAIPDPRADPRDWPRDWQSRVNNALTGLLGNAELAIAAGRRSSPPLARRLQAIADLSLQLRDLLGAPSPAPPA